jgi:hypothetical protein
LISLRSRADGGHAIIAHDSAVLSAMRAVRGESCLSLFTWQHRRSAHGAPDRASMASWDSFEFFHWL